LRTSRGSSTWPAPDGLVLFDRFHHADIDVEELEIVRNMPLSDSTELSLRIRATAALAGRITASLAITGGVHTEVDSDQGDDGGRPRPRNWCRPSCSTARVTSARSARGSRRGWDEHDWASLAEMRGNMSLERIPDPAAYERAYARITARRAPGRFPPAARRGRTAPEAPHPSCRLPVADVGACRVGRDREREAKTPPGARVCSAQIRPPCAVTMARLTDSPTPVPAAFVV
jgi:hypothetical protein